MEQNSNRGSASSIHVYIHVRDKSKKHIKGGIQEVRLKGTPPTASCMAECSVNRIHFRGAGK